MKLVPVLLALLLVLAASPAMAKQKKDPLLALGDLPNASLLFEENG